MQHCREALSDTVLATSMTVAENLALLLDVGDPFASPVDEAESSRLTLLSGYNAWKSTAPSAVSELPVLLAARSFSIICTR